jgi:hypothetical protein
MTPVDRHLVAVGVWSARLMALGVMAGVTIVATAELGQAAWWWWKDRRNAA